MIFTTNGILWQAALNINIVELYQRIKEIQVTSLYLFAKTILLHQLMFQFQPCPCPIIMFPSSQTSICLFTNLRFYNDPHQSCYFTYFIYSGSFLKGIPKALPQSSTQPLHLNYLLWVEQCTPRFIFTWDLII